MKSYKVLCNVFQHGDAYGKKGDVINLPASVGDSYCAGNKPKLEVVKAK